MIINLRPRYTILLLCILAYTQIGCVTPGLTHARVAIVHAIPGDGGFYFSDDDKWTLEQEAIPESYFVKKERGWYMSKAQEIQAAKIIAANENPKVWTP